MTPIAKGAACACERGRPAMIEFGFLNYFGSRVVLPLENELSFRRGFDSRCGSAKPTESMTRGDDRLE